VATYSVPWLHPDPFEHEEGMSSAEIASIHEAVPPGVLSRHRASQFYPVQVPDLIGVKNHHYLDRTGLPQHRGLDALWR
jgi:hypothetical protein